MEEHFQIVSEGICVIQSMGEKSNLSCCLWWSILPLVKSFSVIPRAVLAEGR